MEIASPYSLSRRVPSATRPPLRTREQCRARRAVQRLPGCGSKRVPRSPTRSRVTPLPALASSVPPPTASRSSRACSRSRRTPGEEALAGALAAEARGAAGLPRRGAAPAARPRRHLRARAPPARCARAGRRAGALSLLAGAADGAVVRARARRCPAWPASACSCSWPAPERGSRLRRRGASSSARWRSRRAAAAAFAHQATASSTGAPPTSTRRSPGPPRRSTSRSTSGTLLSRICHEAALLIGADSAVIYRGHRTDELDGLRRRTGCRRSTSASAWPRARGWPARCCSPTAR